jgi:hypothetical protein
MSKLHALSTDKEEAEAARVVYMKQLYDVLAAHLQHDVSLKYPGRELDEWWPGKDRKGNFIFRVRLKRQV